jgi:hypothetical protein
VLYKDRERDSKAFLDTAGARDLQGGGAWKRMREWWLRSSCAFVEVEFVARLLREGRRRLLCLAPAREMKDGRRRLLLYKRDEGGAAAAAVLSACERDERWAAAAAALRER